MVQMGEVSSYTGLLFEIAGKDAGEFTTEELWTRGKKEAIKTILGFPYTILMPCGESLKLLDSVEILDLPIEDVPCPCGNTGHYLIRFIDLRQ